MEAQRPAATPLPRYGRWLSLLRGSLVAGALYDLVFAALMLLAPGLPERLLGIPQPGEAFYLWLMAVFLTMLAGFYLLAAYDPVAYRGNIVIGIVGRLAGAVVLGLGALSDPMLGGLWLLAAGDLTFAIFHAICWWPIRRR